MSTMIGARWTTLSSTSTTWTMPTVSLRRTVWSGRDGNGSPGGSNLRWLPRWDPDIVAYTDTFLAAVDAWLSTGRRRRMRGEVFGFPVTAPHRVVRFVLEDGTGPSTRRVVQPEGSLRDVLERIGERMNVRIGGSLVGQRALRVYGPNEVVIVKPAARRHWMGVSALEDADAVVTDSIAGSPA